MRYKAISATVAASALALALAACGSDDNGDSNNSNDGSGTASDGTGRTFKVGTFAPLSGPASATFVISPKAIKARFAAYKESGGKCSGINFDVIEGDDTSTAEGALSVSQKLVQQDKVDAIVHDSSFFYGASQYLTTDATAKNIPVFGGGYDGAPEYNKVDNNVFGVLQPIDFSTTQDQPGKFFASKGVTKFATVAYDNSPSSKQGMEQTLRSVEAAGIKDGYINSKVPFGSPDVGSIVAGIIDSGADGFYAGINPETSFGIVAGLAQAGYKMKLISLPTGYGSDLLKNSAAVQAAQGVLFSTSFAPTEMQTDATKAMAEALKKGTGNESGIPSFAESLSWAGADELIYGLELAGCDASGADIIKVLRDKGNNWDDGGLLATPRDFTSAEPPTESCSYYVQLQGNAFVPDPANPVCGKVIK